MKNKIKQKYIIIILFIIVKLVIIDNINLFENSFYKNIKEITNPNNILVLVNKNNKLNHNFIPQNLETIDIKYAYDNKKMRVSARTQFEKLSKDAKKLGYRIIAISAYRDFDYQNNLYNNYVLEKGKLEADKCSARPGHSEHQTGLAVDVMGSNNDYNLFEESLEFDWMHKNAHKYGFILRYPKGKEKITGFKYEPWHYRYIGLIEAKIIYQNNLTLEEYFLKYYT